MRSNDQWMAALGGLTPDEDAIAELRDFLRRGLAKALAGRSLGSADLDDFVQDGTLRVLARLASFRGESRFTTWAMTIAIRVAFTELRKRRWQDVSLEDLGTSWPQTADPEADPASRLQERELYGVLRTAIETALTDRQRTVVLAELAGTPGVVLADRLGVQPNALYKMYHDARKNLRRALEDAGFSDLTARSHLEGASTTR